MTLPSHQLCFWQSLTLRSPATYFSESKWQSSLFCPCSLLEITLGRIFVTARSTKYPRRLSNRRPSKRDDPSIFYQINIPVSFHRDFVTFRNLGVFSRWTRPARSERSVTGFLYYLSFGRDRNPTVTYNSTVYHVTLVHIVLSSL